MKVSELIEFMYDKNNLDIIRSILRDLLTVSGMAAIIYIGWNYFSIPGHPLITFILRIPEIICFLFLLFWVSFATFNNISALNQINTTPAVLITTLLVCLNFSLIMVIMITRWH